MASSATVMSSGVPNVATMLKNASSLSRYLIDEVEVPGGDLGAQREIHLAQSPMFAPAAQLGADRALELRGFGHRVASAGV
jgi:hypothetical protein